MWAIASGRVFSFDLTQADMYNTEGVSAVATITELRAETSELVEYVQGEAGREVMVQKNNEPLAVLISWETYLKVKDRIDL